MRAFDITFSNIFANQNPTLFLYKLLLSYYPQVRTLKLSIIVTFKVR